MERISELRHQRCKISRVLSIDRILPIEINTVQSLFAQGLTENGLAELVSAIDQEFGVVIPDSEIHRGKWNDTVSGFSCRRLADLVAAQMRDR